MSYSMLHLFEERLLFLLLILCVEVYGVSCKSSLGQESWREKLICIKSN